MSMLWCSMFFFCKQKTAYEVRISDWSSDVCSSDLGPLGGTVCFAGRGPGEVLRGEAKVVGIRQRRTRAGARFQCAVPVVWEPALLAALLRSEERRVGNECVRTCRSRRTPDPEKTTIITYKTTQFKTHNHIMQ